MKKAWAPERPDPFFIPQPSSFILRFGVSFAFIGRLRGHHNTRLGARNERSVPGVLLAAGVAGRSGRANNRGRGPTHSRPTALGRRPQARPGAGPPRAGRVTAYRRGTGRGVRRRGLRRRGGA